MNQTKKNGKWKRKMEPYAFLVPLVLILFLFLVIPLVKAAIMSFQYYYVTKPSPNGHYFVGLENYGKVLQDEYFFNSVKVTLIYIVVTVAGRYIIGFITALLLNTKFLGRGLARALIIIPWAVPEVVACLVWILMYDKDYGIINFLLNNDSEKSYKGLDVAIQLGAYYGVYSTFDLGFMFSRSTGSFLKHDIVSSGTDINFYHYYFQFFTRYKF